MGTLNTPINKGSSEIFGPECNNPSGYNLRIYKSSKN